MKFGMPSLIELGSLEQNLTLCRKLDLSFIELNMNLPFFQLSDLSNLRPVPDIEYSLHLPEEFNVWDFSDIIRESYLKLIEKTIKIAVDKNIKILNMHMNPGIYFTLPEKKVFLFRKYRCKYISDRSL